MIRPLIRAVAILATLVVTACATATARYSAPVRVLYLTQSEGFVHETVRRDGAALSLSEQALVDMADKSGAFTASFSQDAMDLTRDRLNEIDVLMISTTGALPISEAMFADLVDWVSSAKGGIVAVHSATDTQLAIENGEALWTQFVGGQFLDHPWVQGTPVRLHNLDPDHPLVSAWSDDPDISEEIYQHEGLVPEGVRVLQALDMSYGPLRRPWLAPVAWVKSIGQGRLFYTNLGHTPSTWRDPRFQSQITQAVLWAAGRTDGALDPNPQAQSQASAQAFLQALNLDASPRTKAALAERASEIQRLQALDRSDRKTGSTTYAPMRDGLADWIAAQDPPQGEPSGGRARLP